MTGPWSGPHQLRPGEPADHRGHCPVSEIHWCTGSQRSLVQVAAHVRMLSCHEELTARNDYLGQDAHGNGEVNQ